MNSLIEVTQTVFFTPARLLGQVEYSASPGHGTRATVLRCSIGCSSRLIIAAMVENLYKGRPARLGSIIPIYNHLHLVQDRRAAMVVDSFDANPFREFHNRDHSSHRSG